ncbi:MAG: hypothetical protein IT204_11210 [Fimbriimonadaceae bacterium]|nr:hypothetical protein [Fimbriimonadaceae bacterium]
MILAVYAKAYPGGTADQIAAAAADGFEGLELRGDIDGVPLGQVDADVFRQTCDQAAEAGLQLVTLALGAVDGLAGRRAELRRVGELAGISGARVRLFSSNRPGVQQARDAWEDPSEDLLREEADNLRVCVTALREAWPGVQVMLEAEPISIGNTVVRQARLIELAGVPVGYNWDFVNCWMGGEHPWPGPWSQLEGNLLGVHYKLALADPYAPAEYASQTRPPHDDLPHGALWSAWAAAGFAGPVTVDPHYGLIAERDRYQPPSAQPTVRLVRETLAVMRQHRDRALARF